VRFLLDQDVYAVTARFLTESGHDVLIVAEIGLSQASDEEILRTAQDRSRILVTRDRDYGNLVFVKKFGAGVIYLRIFPTTVNVVHCELARIVQIYSEIELSRGFVVVEPDGHRFRQLPSQELE
jgi:predicted nuclease of predicted toxin-antitoxin system